MKLLHIFFVDGICLNSQGEMFSWGKGLRGQLGHDGTESEEVHTGLPITKALVLKPTSPRAKPEYAALGPISQISAGMIHSAALDSASNRVYVWGKNTIPAMAGNAQGKVSMDAKLPVQVDGLPENLQVLQIACGSHHTAMLLDDGSVWAVGLTTDTKRPVHKPVCLIEAGVVELPVVQFAAHMDRTTVIGASGHQVLQVHLWEHEENRQQAVFTPEWVDHLLDDDPNARIREVHRGWLHTVIVTDTHNGTEISGDSKASVNG
jgi:alpha-tubulin suppressor-like RCC1 family protein